MITIQTMKKIVLLASFLGAVFVALPKEPVSVKKTAKPVEITKTDFIRKIFDYEENKEVWKYKGDKPAIVDFYATWCGPCRITHPILEELAAEYSNEIYIYKVDVDKEPELASLFGVQSIPVFIFIPMNENPQVAVGALPKKTFKSAIDSILLKKETEEK